MLLALAFVLALPQTTAAPLSAPAQCVKAARDFAAAGQKAAAPLTRAKLDKIEADKREMAKACAARIDTSSIDARAAVDMIELYGETGEPDKAAAALAAALARTDLTPTLHADVLVQAVLAGLREPKGDARNARLETLVDQLDAIGPAAFDQQFTAHSRMNGYYRGDDIDAGIIKHSTWMMTAAANFTPAQHKKLDVSVAIAHTYIAEAYAGQGMADKALAILRDGVAKYGAIELRPGETVKESYFDEEIARLELVGRPAAAILAPQWFNRPAGTTAMTLAGHVTLLEFTAHWCGPCRESYPGINRLRAQYGAQGFQVAFVTQLYGYFGADRDLAPAAEIARDRDYFAEHELGDVPVAIGNKVDVKIVNGKVEFLPAKDPNDVAYHVTGIPQIHLIDKHGNIRLIMIGYDDANEPRLAKMIDALLKER